jgi:hypothetical protein
VMLSDGLTTLQADGSARDEVEVLDVAQLLLASVQRGNGTTTGPDPRGADSNDSEQGDVAVAEAVDDATQAESPRTQQETDPREGVTGDHDGV